MECCTGRFTDFCPVWQFYVMGWVASVWPDFPLLRVGMFYFQSSYRVDVVIQNSYPIVGCCDPV